MKLLVIGGSGLLGYKVAKMASNEHETFLTYNYRFIQIEGCTALKLDKCDRKAVFELLEKINPDVVIDTAALHNVDYCETHPEGAWKVNVEGTSNVAEACKKVGAKIIFISTDYVFDGTKGYYTEEDTPNPLSHYAKTKLEAEKIIQSLDVNYIIARPSVIYGWNSNEVSGLKSSSGKSVNFVVWALQKLEKGEEIKAATDQYSSPTLADNLAEALLVMASSEKQGIYHTAGKDCLNRYEFTLKIAEVFGLDKSLIKPVTSEIFKQVAKRPKKCCLDVSKAEKDFGIRFLTVEEGLKLMKNQKESK